MANMERTSSIQYELHIIGETQNVAKGSLKNKVVLPEDPKGLLSFEGKANKTDCIIASASGILTGLLDVFWVGEFSLRDAQTLGREQINQIVIKIASTKGCTKKTLEDSIRFLEKKYANPSDKLTSEFGGGLQHHLRDFSHHASPIGLICSILVQFTGHGYGTDTAGNIINPDIPDGALIGHTFEEKIVYGVVYWMFHLVSDMAGSSNNAGDGTGIPGPILSLMKELSALPVFKDKTINDKEREITFSQWVSKLFNGTVFRHTGYKDLIRFDLRTEVGIVDFGIKQSIPVIINQCVVRAFYFINRLYHEIKDCDIHSVNDLIKIEPGRVLPFNNRCVARMITISSGTFTAVDTIDAAIRTKMKSGGDATKFAAGFLLHINFIGIAYFAIAIKHDAKNIYTDIKEAITGKESEHRIFRVIETQTIEIDADMDNTAIYRYRFDELLQNVKRSREYNDEYNARHERTRGIIFDIRTQEFDDYSKMISYNESWIMHTLERSILNVFDQNNIAYEPAEQVDKRRYFSFIQTEGKKRIGYVFVFSHLKRGLCVINTELREKTDVDEVRFFFALNVETKSDEYISGLNRISEENFCSFLKFAYLKDFFDQHIKAGEYEVFKEYVDDFNEKAKNIIAYKTVVVPTVAEIEAFKTRKAEMLRNYDYESLLPEDMYNEQKAILKRNYINRELYKALLGEMDFSDSFITSEWNYDVNRSTDVLDQTGVVAGYLKSIEQLLYAVIKLSINKNKFIYLKNGEEGEFNSDNEEHISSTLGSLTYFVKYNGDILDVNNYTKRFIVDTLFRWADDERNGPFHKDNFHDLTKVKEIREQALLLYYLILGGFTIKKDQLDKLGISDPIREAVIDEEELYQRFKMWASPVILYDVSKQAGAVGFMINAFVGKPWDIALQAMKDSTELDYRWNWSQLFSTSYLANNFSLESSPSWEDGLKQIIRFVERLLKEETPAALKLKSIPKIIIGSLEVHKVFENLS